MSYQDIIYKHTKGHFYRVIHFGLDEETLEPEVAYRQCDREGKFSEGQTFHRKCTVFFDGRFKPVDSWDPEEPEVPEELPPEVKNIFVEEATPPLRRPRPEPLVLDQAAFLGETDHMEFAPKRRVVPRRVVPEGQDKGTTAGQVEGWNEGGFGDGKL